MSNSSLGEKLPIVENLETIETSEGNIEDFITETRPWYKVPHLRALSFHVFVIALSSTTSGYDGSVLNGYQSLEAWRTHLGNPTGYVLGALSSAPIFGGILVSPFAPLICDHWGRKWGIFIGEVIVVIASILQGFSTNYAFFFVSRFLIGVGGVVAAVGSPSLISEIAYPKHREISTFSYNLQWYTGAVIAALITYGMMDIKGNNSWRGPSFIQGFLPLVQLLLLWWVPESPRFLISKGRIEEARAVFSKYHTGDSSKESDLQLVEFEIREVEIAIENERAASNASYLDFFKKPNMRKRLFLLFFVACMMQFSGNGLVSYYLSKVLTSIGITDSKKQLQINFCLMIYNLVVSTAVCCTSNFFKRRTLFLTCVIGMLTTYIIWTILSAINQKTNFENASLGQGVLAMIFLYYLSYNIGVNGLPFLYMTEILPYSYRAKGLNIFQVIQQVVLVYNGFVNPIAMDAIDWKYYIVFCCIIAVEIVVVFFTFPETSGRTLEEVAEVFDGKFEHPNVDLESLTNKRSLEHNEHVEKV